MVILNWILHTTLCTQYTYVHFLTNVTYILNDVIIQALLLMKT